jgi:hypothetical protein
VSESKRYTYHKEGYAVILIALRIACNLVDV